MFTYVCSWNGVLPSQKKEKGSMEKKERSLNKPWTFVLVSPDLIITLKL